MYTGVEGNKRQVFSVPVFQSSNELLSDCMLQAVAASTAQPKRHLVAGGSGSDTPAIYLWERVILEPPQPQRRAAAEPAVERAERPVIVVDFNTLLLALVGMAAYHWAPSLRRWFGLLVQIVTGFFGQYRV